MRPAFIARSQNELTGPNAGAVQKSPAIVGHGGYVAVPDHCIHFVDQCTERIRVSQEVVPVYGCPWRDSPHACGVVAGGDDPGHLCPVVLSAVKYVSFVGVVMVKVGEHVVHQVLVERVHSVVHYGHADALSQVSVRPGGLDVYVPIVGGVQVPLASIERVRYIRVV